MTKTPSKDFDDNAAYGTEGELAVVERMRQAGLPAELATPSSGNWHGSVDIRVGDVLVEVKRRGFVFKDGNDFKHQDAIVDNCKAFDEKLKQHHIGAVVVLSQDMKGALVFPVDKRANWRKMRHTDHRDNPKESYCAPLSDAISLDEYIERLREYLKFDAEITELLLLTIQL